MKSLHSGLEPLLLACGLDRKAAAVYLAALDGPASIAELARRAGLYRTDVYAALPKLKALGLVTRSRKEKRALYSPAPTARLEKLAKARLRGAAGVLASLSREERLGPVRVLTGAKGLQDVLNDMAATLKRGATFYRVSARKPGHDAERYVPRGYREIRDRKKLEQFVITNAALKTGPYRGRIECFSKAVPKEESRFEENVAQVIYGDKIAFVDYGTETAVIVENPALARMAETLFRLLFKRL